MPVHVIRDFYMKMREYVGAYRYIPDQSLPKAIIFDLDGTLAIHDGRGPFELDKLGTDKPNHMIVEYAKMAAKLGYAVITVSGRESGTKESPMCYYGATIDWMNQHDIPWVTHIQREQGDSRSDDIVKLEIFRNTIAPFYNVCLAVDDRQQVVDMWRSIGVECWQVAYGDF
ncbi:polynucleotide 5'-kinase and 3'-phosphatase [Serratia phage 4S]|nr:polynucleotide 5'-kinase and 3'-phosphatase [Serratia phage 4S]